MSHASEQFETVTEISGAARQLHPEDISVGDDVAVSASIREYPSFWWCGSDSIVHPREQLVRIRYRNDGDFHAWSVKNICLPFVLVEDENEKCRVLDLRMVQLYKLESEFAAAVRKRTAKKKKNKKGR